MKKVYLKPITETATYECKAALLNESGTDYWHGEAKGNMGGNGGGGMVITNGQIDGSNNNNLWDD